MAIADASIKRARSSQGDLKKRREHCSADPETLAAIGREVGHQVRIDRTGFKRPLQGERGPQETRTTSSASARRSEATRQDHQLHGRDRLACAASDHLERRAEARASSSSGFGTMAARAARCHRAARRRHRAPTSTGRLSASGRAWASRRPARGAARVGTASGEPSSAGTSRPRHQRGELSRLDSVISRGFTYAVAFDGVDESGILIGGRRRRPEAGDPMCRRARDGGLAHRGAHRRARRGIRR